MLWILTQNKQSMVNVKEVTVKGKYIEGVIGSAFLDQWSKTLGKYESNERALEVINEIFVKMEEGNVSPVMFYMPEK